MRYVNPVEENKARKRPVPSGLAADPVSRETGPDVSYQIISAFNLVISRLKFTVIRTWLLTFCPSGLGRY